MQSVFKQSGHCKRIKKFVEEVQELVSAKQTLSTTGSKRKGKRKGFSLISLNSAAGLCHLAKQQKSAS